MAELLVSKLIKVLEGVRIAEGLTYSDFVTHFDISIQAYHAWRKSARKGEEPIDIKLSNVQRGLESLGYNYYIIIEKIEK